MIADGGAEWGMRTFGGICFVVCLESKELLTSTGSVSYAYPPYRFGYVDPQSFGFALLALVLVLVHGTKAGAYVRKHVDSGKEVPVKRLKQWLMVTVTVTFTMTAAAGAGHESAPVTRPTVNCLVRGL